MKELLPTTAKRGFPDRQGVGSPPSWGNREVCVQCR